MVALYGVAFVSVSASFIEPPRPPVKVTMVNLRDPNYKMYLPVLLGADPPPAAGTAEEGRTPKAETTALPLDRPRGLSYPGPQPIVSDFPNPTNRIQTILQPALKDPVILP